MDYLTERSIFELREDLPRDYFTKRNADINSRIETEQSSINLSTLVIVWAVAACIAIAGGGGAHIIKERWEEARVAHAPV